MKFLRILFCVAMVLTVGLLIAAPGINSIKQRISQGNKLWESDSPKAQQILSQAFADAINWTKADYVDSVREQGFFLAISCFSPALVEQVALAAETYVKVFPEGKNLKKVNLYRAMAAYAMNEPALAEAAINAAIKTGGKLNHSEQTFVLSGYFAGAKHRTAEHFIEGQQEKRPSALLKKDLRRFHSGNRLIEGLLQKVADGRISGEKAVAALEAAMPTSWFAKKAPQAALTAIALRDGQAPYFNSIRTSWCGLERVVKHAASPQIRLKRLTEFVDNFPQANPGERFKALVDLYYLYKLEFREPENAAKIFARLPEITEFSRQAEIEAILARFTPRSIRTESGYNDLKRLRELAPLLAYDNGTMPVLTLDYVEYLMAIAEMILDKNSQIVSLNRSGWENLPVDILYQAACGQKAQAFASFKKIENNQTAQIRKLFTDLVFPLYKPMRSRERLFLAGLAAVEALPDFGTDLIVEAISGHSRMYKAEHGLAALADIYNRHMAYAEAQKVWNTLSDLYPDSIWLK